MFNTQVDFYTMVPNATKEVIDIFWQNSHIFIKHRKVFYTFANHKVTTTSLQNT